MSNHAVLIETVVEHAFRLLADHHERKTADVRSGIARLNDVRDAGEGKLGEALRPLYIDYLAKHAPKRPPSSG